MLLRSRAPTFPSLSQECSTSGRVAALVPTYQGLRPTRLVAASQQGYGAGSSWRPGRGLQLAIQARADAVGMGLWGTKAGMTTVFQDDEDGLALALPCTVIAFDTGNIVTQVKTEETHGYSAVQVGYEEVPERKITKPEAGHLKKAGLPPLRKLKEYRLKDVSAYEAGQQLKLEEIFKVGDKVDVAGKSIGKGFAGTIKRHHMRRGAMSHGSKSKRERGSIGASATPSRVMPGLRMAGRLGHTRVTIPKLEVLIVDTEANALVVKGSIPGKPGNVVEITPAKTVGKNC